MTPAQLITHFNRVCEAPDAIPRLRQFILDLAIRGKLVEQDPNDEPASELLQQVEAEKGRLVKKGEIKPPEIFEPPTPDEFPFALPMGWRMARMGCLARKLGAGSTPLGGKSVYQAEGVPFLRSQNVYDAGLRLEDVALISRETHEKMIGTHVQQQDLLLNITGASIGRCALVPPNFQEGNVSQHVAIIRLFIPALRQFIHLSLISPYFQKMIDDVQVGVSREGLSMQRLRLFPILIPPLAEQHRIVAKVDELMALCDRLEAAQTEREKQRDRLLASSLQRLNQPDGDASVFREYARFQLRHLQRLIARPEQVAQLRETILNLAVRGLLVQQSSRDAPSSEILSCIESERARLTREGALKRASSSPLISSDAVPFNIPAGWTWVRLQQLLEPQREISYGIIKLGDEPKDAGIYTIRCSDVKSRSLNLSNIRKVSEEIEREYLRTRLVGGEILLNIRGTLGGVALVPKELMGYNVAREVSVIPISRELSGSYLVNVMASPYFWQAILNGLRGIAYKGLNLNALRLFEIPLPPLAEQHRIVAKVDELMAVCDELEAQLTTAQTERRRFLEAVLQEALAAAA